MNIILITVYLIALYIIEALHDNYVIRAGETDHSFNPKWHKVDAIFHFMVWLLISLLMNDFVYILLGGAIRVVFFQNMLNVFRGKKFFYLGNGGFDGYMKRKMGNAASYVIFITGLLFIITINLLPYLNINLLKF